MCIQHRIQRPGRGRGQETWNLCGCFWWPSFLWLVCTGLGEGGMAPSAPPLDPLLAFLDINGLNGGWIEIVVKCIKITYTCLCWGIERDKVFYFKKIEHDVIYSSNWTSRDGKERLNTLSMRSFHALNNDSESLPRAATGFLTHLSPSVMES